MAWFAFFWRAFAAYAVFAWVAGYTFAAYAFMACFTVIYTFSTLAFLTDIVAAIAFAAELDLCIAAVCAVKSCTTHFSDRSVTAFRIIVCLAAFFSRVTTCSCIVIIAVATSLVFITTTGAITACFCDWVAFVLAFHIWAALYVGSCYAFFAVLYVAACTFAAKLGVAITTDSGSTI